jgi:hypothetical protein
MVKKYVRRLCIIRRFITILATAHNLIPTESHKPNLTPYRYHISIRFKKQVVYSHQRLVPQNGFFPSSFNFANICHLPYLCSVPLISYRPSNFFIAFGETLYYAVFSSFLSYYYFLSLNIKYIFRIFSAHQSRSYKFSWCSPRKMVDQDSHPETTISAYIDTNETSADIWKCDLRYTRCI